MTILLHGGKHTLATKESCITERPPSIFNTHPKMKHFDQQILEQMSCQILIEFFQPHFQQHFSVKVSRKYISIMFY